MKILQEKLLMNDLENTINLVNDDEIYIIHRKSSAINYKDAVIMSVDSYNEIMKQIYEAKQGNK